MEEGVRSGGEAPACLRPPCRAQGTLLLSAQLQLVTHLRAGLGGVRDKSRTLRGIFSCGNPRRVGRRQGCCFHPPPPQGSPCFPRARLENLQEESKVGGWVGVLPCPFLVLTFPHLGLTADKDEGEHPNNSFSPCSAHDRRCLQKHFAKIRDRSSSGGKMKVIGVPREEARPVVRTSDLQILMCAGTHTTGTTTRSGRCSFGKRSLDACCVQEAPSMRHQDRENPHSFP